ncbi:MAG: 4a-hydroxytetrahydrobiopterin dehydratase [Candidatus Omnitrophica bacterium]|nr:4a-hydroxytetrahydrobiopterin dehydratase [Candidatus Omnitrophota bacterium]
MTLAEKKCAPCEGKEQSLTKESAQKLLNDVPGWKMSSDVKMISREFVMKNFMAAVKIIDKAAVIAEEENHHPDFHLVGYRNLRIDLSTHAVKGLTENDFIVAAKINALPMELKTPEGNKPC